MKEDVSTASKYQLNMGDDKVEEDVSTASKYQLNMGDNKVLISSSPEREVSEKAKYVVWVLKVN